MSDTTNKGGGRFKVGDWVTFQYGVERVRARVIGARGPIGPQRLRYYRIEFSWTATPPESFDLPESALEPAQPPAEAAAS